jgi:subtilisin family serine protease
VRASGAAACAHGTFVAGILGARRGSLAPALCPACPLLVRPVFLDADRAMPHTTVAELSTAIQEVLQSGARIIDLSLALTRGSAAQDQSLGAVLDWAAQKDVLLVAAAGNDGRVSSTALTRHPWVLPVVSCDAGGHPSRFANVSGSAGRHGLMAPGEGLVSLDSEGGTRAGAGTSFAAAVDVVFAYAHRTTDITDKYLVRVDVTEEFPLLAGKMQPYFDR